jgi:translation initiation factor IF-2
MAKKVIGEVTHYFSNINVAVVKLSVSIKKGTKVSFEGTTTNFEQALDSMQIDRKDVDEAKKGQSIGVKVSDRVREGDKVFMLS